MTKDEALKEINEVRLTNLTEKFTRVSRIGRHLYGQAQSIAVVGLIDDTGACFTIGPIQYIRDRSDRACLADYDAGTHSDIPAVGELIDPII